MLVSPPPGPFDSGQLDYAQVSAFTALRWDNGIPFVQVVGHKDDWYELIEFNGISVDSLNSFCKSRKWNVKKRFAEDLIQVARLMDSEPGMAITLRLMNQTGDAVFLPNVIMTEDARRQCVHPFNSGASDYPAWSPFVDAKWTGEDVLVRLPNDPRWYELISIHGIQIGSILAACEENNWKTNRRTTEDLIQLVRLMGYKIEKTTSLKLGSSDGVVSTLDNVEMSAENLSQVLANTSEQATVNRLSNSNN